MKGVLQGTFPSHLQTKSEPIHTNLPKMPCLLLGPAGNHSPIVTILRSDTGPGFLQTSVKSPPFVMLLWLQNLERLEHVWDSAAGLSNVIGHCITVLVLVSLESFRCRILSGVTSISVSFSLLLGRVLQSKAQESLQLRLCLLAHSKSLRFHCGSVVR